MPEYPGDGYDAVEKRLLSETYEWVEAIVFSLAFVVLLFSLVFRIAGISGVSMENTLNQGVEVESQRLDRLLISDLNYTPKYGDIVVIRSKKLGVIVKRVIAVGGQTVNVDFQKGTVSVDGKILSESYIKEPTRRQGDVIFPLKVPAGHVFVMGDNRNDSHDSRFSDVGCIDNHDIIGRAYFRIYPFNRIGPL